jgi:carboxylesterase type B
VRDAFAYGPTPPQQPLPPSAAGLIPNPFIPGDDCLNLNIWTSSLGPAGQPVMVWIPGGAFELGTGAAYDGSRFARDGVVCVTINYRVGADGFLYLGDGDDANLGLRDQMAALEWVRDNIAAFGGAPDNITIFGESAGGMSVGTLLAVPRAEGLFRRAIAQSGAAHHVLSAATAQHIGRYLAEKVGVPATRAAIAAVPVDRLLRAQAEMKAELATSPDPEGWGVEVVRSNMPFHPVVDGDIVPARPIERIAAGASEGVDLLVGTTTDEWRLFLVVTGALEKVTPEAVAGTAALYGLPAESTLAAYRAAHPGASAGDLLAALQTDWWCRIPALRLADAHAARGAAPTYMYEFAWRTPQFGGLLGACHGLEIAFVFDKLDKETEPLLGPNPPQQLADTMHAAWVSFATRGDCGWPRYDHNRRATMRFDVQSTVVDDPHSAERALWEGVR